MEVRIISSGHSTGNGGVATITATSEEGGYSATCEVTVNGSYN